MRPRFGALPHQLQRSQQMPPADAGLASATSQPSASRGASIVTDTHRHRLRPQMTHTLEALRTEHEAPAGRARRSQGHPRGVAPCQSGVPGHPRGLTPRRRLTRSLVTLTVRWTVPRAPVGTCSALGGILARQSRAAVRRAGWRRSQRMPLRRLRPSGVLRPTEVGTYRISVVAIGRCNEHRPGVHACRPGAERVRHSEPAAASAAARGSSSAISWSSSVGVRMS